MYVITETEAQRNERSRKALRRHCAACGSQLNRYAATSRVLCTLCLSHDREARLLCARRRMAGYRTVADPERLEDIEVDALHEALWRMAGAELAEGLLIDGLELSPVRSRLQEGGRLLVADKRRILGIYIEERERLIGDLLQRLRRGAHLLRLGYASYVPGVTSLWSVYAIYPRAYDPLGDR